MKFDHFLAVLRNRVLPDPVFIPLTIKYLLENGPTANGVLYDHYIDFLERNHIPVETGTTRKGAIVKTCPSQPDPHAMQEDMYDLELINESIQDDLSALSLTLEDPIASESFKDVKDFDGKGLLVEKCQEKIDTYLALPTWFHTDDKDWVKFNIEWKETDASGMPSGADIVKADKDDREYFFDIDGKSHWEYTLKKYLAEKFRQDEEIVAGIHKKAREKLSAKYGPTFDPYGGIDPESSTLGMRIFRMMEILIPELRRFIQAVLKGERDQDGKPWHTSETYVPKHILEQTNNQLKHYDKYTEKLHADLFVEYMPEGGLVDVITHNWQKFFKVALDDNKDILHNLEEIKRKRDKTFHFHKLSPEQQEMWVKKLEAYVTEIVWYTKRYEVR